MTGSNLRLSDKEPEFFGIGENHCNDFASQVKQILNIILIFLK